MQQQVAAIPMVGSSVIVVEFERAPEMLLRALEVAGRRLGLKIPEAGVSFGAGGVQFESAICRGAGQRSITLLASINRVRWDQQVSGGRTRRRGGVLRYFFCRS